MMLWTSYSSADLELLSYFQVRLRFIESVWPNGNIDE